MGLEDISTLDPDQIRENLRQFGETGSGRLRVRHRLRDGSLREVYVYTTHLVVDGHAMNLAQVFELSADGAAPAQDAGAN
jgi:hypothetical protein